MVAVAIIGPASHDPARGESSAVATLSNEQVVQRYAEAHARHDYEALASLRAPGWIEEWPQSRERVRGHANDAAIMAAWPGGEPHGEDMRLVGSEDRWVMTPAWTYQRIRGAGDQWWGDAIAHYPDGSTWFAVGLFEIHDGQVHHETWYFAPELEAPEWRAGWVERMEPAHRSHGR